MAGRLELDNTPQPTNYSGINKIPNVQEFLNRLDRQKKQRDAEIDAELEQNRTNGESKDHIQEKRRSRKKTRTVRDPVTGKDVEIEDASMDFREVVDNPVVCKFRHWPLNWRRLGRGSSPADLPLDIGTKREPRQEGEHRNLVQAVRRRVQTRPRRDGTARPRRPGQHFRRAHPQRQDLSALLQDPERQL